MEISHFTGFDVQTGNPMFSVCFNADEGECCGDILGCRHEPLDPPVLDDEILECLIGNRYGNGNCDLPLESIPETGGLTYVDWISEVGRRWDRFTGEQQNRVFIIAYDVYPEDADPYGDLQNIL